jgi:hypothetical protein
MRDDAKFIVALVNTPGWVEFIGDRNIRQKPRPSLILKMAHSKVMSFMALAYQ